MGHGRFAPFINNGSMTKGPIKLAKELSGLTGEQLAEKLGISPAHLSRMNSRKRKVTTDTIDKLAAICGKTSEEFFHLMGQKPGDVESATEQLTGHDVDELLLINPDIFKKAYERARAIEQTMLGGRGSNADFAIILEQAYADIAEQEDS